MIKRAALALFLAAGCGAVVLAADAPAEKKAEAPAVPAAAEPNTLTQAEKDAGWRLLFDGKTTTGWRKLGADEFPKEGWVVENGALRHVEMRLANGLTRVGRVHLVAPPVAERGRRLRRLPEGSIKR